MPSGSEPQDGSRRRWYLVRASTDAIPSSVRRFMRRARQRRLRAAAPWGLLAATAAVLALLGWLVFVSPVLGVRQIEVTGVLILDPDQVKQAAAVANGTPLARVDSDAVRSRVGALPAAGSVTVSRRWPSTLVIVVVERTPIGAVPNGKQFDLLDGHGVIFDTVPHPPSGVVTIRLATPGPQDESTQAALTVIAALTAKLRSELVTLVVDGPARIRLELRKDRIVTWGDAEDSELKAKVATALLAGPHKRIDVSAPEVVTFR
jgi:cell division protein FtsQ